MLLQVMEDGVLTDGKGRAINFKNVILVMTSNVGGRKILELVGQQKLARLERVMNNGGGEGRKKKKSQINRYLKINCLKMTPNNY